MRVFIVDKRLLSNDSLSECFDSNQLYKKSSFDDFYITIIHFYYREMIV
jgi:hypothetical protein